MDLEVHVRRGPPGVPGVAVVAEELIDAHGVAFGQAGSDAGQVGQVVAGPVGLDDVDGGASAATVWVGMLGGPSVSAGWASALRTALTPESHARAAAVAGTIRTDGATVAATMLLDGLSRGRLPASA